MINLFLKRIPESWTLSNCLFKFISLLLAKCFVIPFISFMSLFFAISRNIPVNKTSSKINPDRLFPV